jgi:hypothetical protein
MYDQNLIALVEAHVDQGSDLVSLEKDVRKEFSLSLVETRRTCREILEYTVKNDGPRRARAMKLCQEILRLNLAKYSGESKPRSV